MSHIYELVIYTASLSKYADPLMDILDTENCCSYRLFREHCTFYNGVFVKDMSMTGRPLKDSIIIDNSPSAYMFQPECALPILSWFDDMNDNCLYDLIPLLEALAQVDDVRLFIRRFVYDNQIDFPRAMDILNKKKKKLQFGDDDDVPLLEKEMKIAQMQRPLINSWTT